MMILLVQVVAIAVTYWPRSTTETAAGPLLGDLQAEEVSRITFTGSDGVEIELARGGDGWLLPGVDEYPALDVKIDETLASIDSGDYGFCNKCGVEIGIKRLEARPTATLCIDCKTLAEIKEKQEMG